MPVQIHVRGVGKRYRHGTLRTRGLAARVRGGAGSRERSFWALRDVSFDVARGRTLGIVGPNGSGKSTLLRLLGGVGRADEGTVDVRGSVAGIFELGAGFHPELTGRESAILSSVISGLARNDAIRRMPEIAAFAELEEFLDDPIRTYSTGMVARLAFAVATQVDAEVLLVDEALAVGDLAFQAKCIDRLEGFQRDGVTIVLVSHAPASLRQFCDDVLWLHGGRVLDRGSPEDVTARYASHMRELARDVTPRDLDTRLTDLGAELKPLENRVGSQEAVLSSVRLVDRLGNPVQVLTTGEPLHAAIDVDAPHDLGPVNVVFHVIRDEDAALCLDASTVLHPPRNGGRRRSVRLECSRLDLAAGRYSCEVGVYSSDWSRPFDHHSGVYPLTISGAGAGRGILSPPITWRILQPDEVGEG